MVVTKVTHPISDFTFLPNAKPANLGLKIGFWIRRKEHALRICSSGFSLEHAFCYAHYIRYDFRGAAKLSSVA